MIADSAVNLIPGSPQAHRRQNSQRVVSGAQQIRAHTNLDAPHRAGRCVAGCPFRDARDGCARRPAEHDGRRRVHRNARVGSDPFATAAPRSSNEPQQQPAKCPRLLRVRDRCLSKTTTDTRLSGVESRSGSGSGRSGKFPPRMARGGRIRSETIASSMAGRIPAQPEDGHRRTSASVVGAACRRPAPCPSSKQGDPGTALPLDPAKRNSRPATRRRHRPSPKPTLSMAIDEMTARQRRGDPPTVGLIDFQRPPEPVVLGAASCRTVTALVSR
jgi:hypothetical protein